MTEVIGLIVTGVFSIAVAASTIWLKDYLSNSNDNKKKKAEVKLLATNIWPKLRDYSLLCYQISHDDGSDDFGMPAGGEENTTTVASTKFSISDYTEYQWQSLSTDLLRDFLFLDEKYRNAINHLNSPLYDDPPEHTLYFLERQLIHAKIGLFSLGISNRLFSEAGFVSIADEQGLNMEALFKTRIGELERSLVRFKEAQIRVAKEFEKSMFGIGSNPKI